MPEKSPAQRAGHGGTSVVFIHALKRIPFHLWERKGEKEDSHVVSSDCPDLVITLACKWILAYSWKSENLTANRYKITVTHGIGLVSPTTGAGSMKSTSPILLYAFAIAGLLTMFPAHSLGGVLQTAQFQGNTYHLLDTNGSKWWFDSQIEARQLGDD